jgi:hypothetical protein
LYKTPLPGTLQGAKATFGKLRSGREWRRALVATLAGGLLIVVNLAARAHAYRTGRRRRLRAARADVPSPVATSAVGSPAAGT